MKWKKVQNLEKISRFIPRLSTGFLDPMLSMFMSMQVDRIYIDVTLLN